MPDEESEAPETPADDPEPDDDIPETPARPRKQNPPKKRGLQIGGLVGLGIVLAILLVPWLMRHSIATSMARDRLAAAGLTCDENFRVEVSAFFGSASFQPTRCTTESGHVEAVELTEQLDVELDGFEPTAIDARHVRLTLRDRDIEGADDWDRSLRRLHLEERVAGLVKAIGELSALPLPPTTVALAEVIRDGDQVAQIDDLELTPGDPMAIRIRSVSFGQLTLNGVTGTATRDHVVLEGEAVARAGFGPLQFSQEGSFSLDASRLDQRRPRFTLQTSLQ